MSFKFKKTFRQTIFFSWPPAAVSAAGPAAVEAEERPECGQHGIGARRIELRVLLLSCLACGLFGAAGRISAHIAAGAFSGLLLTHHVWERRHSL